MTKSTIFSQIKSFVLQSVKHESDFMGLIRKCVEYDAKCDISKGSAVQSLISELHENGLETYSRRVKSLAVTKFHFFSETAKEGAGYDKVPTAKEIETVFSKYGSIEGWSEDNKKRIIAQSKKTEEKKKETNKAKDIVFRALEESRKSLNDREQKKLDKVIALVKSSPALFK